jgi:hypothetical protein
MSNDLTIKDQGLLATVTQTDLSDLIKPLVNEIHLFDTYVAGTSYVEDKSVFDIIETGDRLTLVREENKFDDNAIVISTKDGKKLGYIPEKDNLIFSRLMDAGKLLMAKVSSHEVKGTFHRIAIGVYLVDY